MEVSAKYRWFLHVYGIFHRWMPGIWFTGCGLCLLVAMLGRTEPWLEVVCLVTIYPVLVGWLLLNGMGMLWSAGRRMTRAGGKKYWLRGTLAVMIGLVFSLSGIAILVAIIRLMMGM